VVLALWLVAAPVLADDGGRTAIFGQDFTLEPGKRLDSDLVVVGGRVRLQPDSVVAGDVIIMGGEVTLEGQVNGDVVIFGGSAELESTAVIEKDLVVIGQLRRQHGATVKGNVVEGLQASRAFTAIPETLIRRPGVAPVLPPAKPAHSDAYSWFVNLLRNVMTLVAILVVAALLVMLLPENLRRIRYTMEHSAVFSLGVGALTIVVLAISLPILTITCIGMPFVVVLVIGFLLAALVAWAVAGQVIGQRALRALNIQGRTALFEMLVGVLAISILSRVPCIGWLFLVVALSWGLGAVVLTHLGGRIYPPLAPFADKPTPPQPPTPPEPRPDAPASAPRRGDTHPLDASLLEADDGPNSGSGARV
jgi:energy-converting hydrogenase Eha subunit A